MQEPCFETNPTILSLELVLSRHLLLVRQCILLGRLGQDKTLSQTRVSVAKQVQTYDILCSLPRGKVQRFEAKCVMCFALFGFFRLDHERSVLKQLAGGGLMPLHWSTFIYCPNVLCKNILIVIHALFVRELFTIWYKLACKLSPHWSIQFPCGVCWFPYEACCDDLSLRLFAPLKSLLYPSISYTPTSARSERYPFIMEAATYNKPSYRNLTRFQFPWIERRSVDLPEVFLYNGEHPLLQNPYVLPQGSQPKRWNKIYVVMFSSTSDSKAKQREASNTRKIPFGRESTIQEEHGL